MSDTTNLANLKLVAEKQKSYADSKKTTLQNQIDAITSNGYTSVKVDSSAYSTMGALRNYLNSINSQGKHVLFDFSAFTANAYVCTVSFWTANSTNYCSIFDLINKKLYVDYAGYSDSTSVSAYLSTHSNDIVHTISLTNQSMTLSQVKTILDEVNSLGDHVLFDTYSLGQDGFYLTTISYNQSASTLTVFDLVGAKLNTVAYKSDMTLVEVMQGAEQVITEYNARVITDLIAKLSHRVAVLEGSSETADWDLIQARVVQGLGKENYPTYDPETKTGNGTQITVSWASQTSSGGSETTYDMPFNVVYHSEKASTDPISILDDTWTIDSYHTSNSAGTDVGSESCHANYMMYMESQYTLPYGTQFDAREALVVVGAGGLAAGDYYVGSGSAWYSFTLTDNLSEGAVISAVNETWYSDVPASLPFNAYSELTSKTALLSANFLLTKSTTQPTTGTYLGYWGHYQTVHKINDLNRVFYGYNRWSQSAVRQWLNAEGFNWWKPMNDFDRPPSYIGYRGYMSGLSNTLKSCIKPVRRWQWLNTVTDGGVYEYTYDKIFLHTPYERYTENNGTAKEGSCARWPWYCNLLDTWNTEHSTSLTKFALWQTYDILKRYSISNKTSSQHYWSSDPYRGYSYLVSHVYSSGLVSSDSACNGNCCLPAFVISL